MRKNLTKFVCLVTAAAAAAGLALTAGCGNWTTDGLTADDYTEVESNGGFVVQTDDYVYFINGVGDNTADNTFGTPVKGSIQRISKQDLQAGNYTSSQTVVPLIAYSAYYYAGIYIYGDNIYYATPSTARNSSGEIQNSYLEFKSSTLDGSQTMSDYYYRSSSTSLEYRYVEVDSTVYLMYAASESLYDESSSVTNLHSINLSTGEDTLLAYNVSAYSFDTEDPTNPYVFYTMDVTYFLGSDNEIDEEYNQLYVVRADQTEAGSYDFSYVEDYDADEDPLYINCGDLVYDGIGSEAYENRYSQFNYGWTQDGDSSYTINRTNTTYAMSYYKSGVLMFTVQESLDSAAGLYRLELDDIDSDGDGQVDSAWDAIEQNENDNLIAGHRLLISDSGTEYSFVTLDGEEWVLYNGENGLELGQFIDGEIQNDFPITDSGTATILAIRDETTAAEDGEGTDTHTYVYYSLTGGNGYTFYRIALSTNSDNYRPNMLPYKDVYTYSEVQILDLDAVSSWYLPEFVGNTIIFASETEGMTDYNYIMACDLSSGDGDMMSNAELNDYTELYEGVAEKIAEYDEETNSDGSLAYENLSNALTYAFYTGDRDYLAELIQAYVDIEEEDEEYVYSVESAQIYVEFCDAEGDYWDEDWAEDYSDAKQIDGETVHANMQKYYYSLLGVMTEDDEEALRDYFRDTYMQAYPEDTSTWWDNMGTAWQIVFIVAMCVAGIAVIAGAVILTIWLVRRKKNKKNGEGRGAASNIDITDDKNIDVYSDDNGETPEGEE